MKKIMNFTFLVILPLLLMPLHSYSNLTAQPITIYNIQFTTDPRGNSPYAGQTVTTVGVVTGTFSDGFTIAEGAGPWKSIFVYTKKFSPTLGDRIRITGSVKEYNGLTEIVDVSAFNFISSNNNIPPYTVITSSAKAEQFESVLIKIIDANVTSLNPFGEWTITDANGNIICDDKNDYMYYPKVGDHINSIAGILFYYNQQFKLEPRFTADIDCVAIPHYAIFGDVVTMNNGFDILYNSYIEILGDRIINVSKFSPAEINIVNVDGFIFPGLIDAHNHPQWNILDKIPFGRTFSDRYEWQSASLYAQVQNQFSDILNHGGGGAQQANLFKLAEVRALCSGTTTIQGFNCNDYAYDSFARQGIGINNAERFPGLIYTDVFPLSRSTSFWQTKSGEYWKRFAIHLSEGINSSALQEFDQWKSMDMLDGRTTIIHGIPLRRSEFLEMKRVSANLIWSPSSNWSLYNSTANVPTALSSGVNVALAPDWTESGMPDLLTELKFASWINEKLWSGRITNKNFIELVTCNASKALGLEKYVGAIAVGMKADIVVVPKIFDDPYTSLISSNPKDVKLTITNGRPMYGDPSIMNKFPFLDNVENIEICGSQKKVALKNVSHAIPESGKLLSTIITELSTAYNASNPKICSFLNYDNCSSSNVVNISIDIKPGSNPKTININSNGVISVAILTTHEFDATTVLPLSVRFGPNEAPESHAKGHIEDFDNDGDLDLVLHFETQKTGLANGQTSATLTGLTSSGTKILGVDAIQIVDKNSKLEIAETEGVVETSTIPETYFLMQNYPNPFNPSTTIKFGLPENSLTKIIVYDLLGREVSTLLNKELNAGYHGIFFDASNFVNGVYFYRMITPSFTSVKKFILMK